MTETNTLATFDILRERLSGVKPCGDGYIALCPGHNGDSPSANPVLSIWTTNDKIFMKCSNMNCTLHSIVTALNHTIPELPSDWMNDLAGYAIPDPDAVTTPAPILKYEKNDRGVSLILKERFGADIRYIGGKKGHWLRWNGAYWERDENNRMYEYFDKIIRDVHISAAICTGEDRTAFAKWAAYLSNDRVQNSALVFASKNYSDLKIEFPEVDQKKMMINFKNKCYDLENELPKEQRREDFITRMAPVSYDPKALCPNWLSFLEMIFNGNTSLIDFVQRAAGYSLSGLCDERCIFILYGKGRNGKSTLVETLARMMGDYSLKIPAETLTSKRFKDSSSNDIAMLRGVRLAHAGETNSHSSFNEGLIKSLTGCDTVTGRFLYEEYFSFRPEFKIWFSTNHKPKIRGTDNAIWDRIRLIPFNVRIDEERSIPDSEVEKMFNKEMSGILNWALEGFQKYREDGCLKVVAEVQEATKEYETENDILGMFIEECCEVAPNSKETVAALFEAYRKWCDTSKEWEISKMELSQRLRERGFEKPGRGMDNKFFWKGICLKRIT